MFGSKETKGFSFNSAKSSLPNATSLHGPKGAYTKAGDQPSTSLNTIIYENTRKNRGITSNTKKPQNSTTRHPPSSIDERNKFTKDKQNATDGLDIATTPTQPLSTSSEKLSTTKSSSMTTKMPTTKPSPMTKKLLPMSKSSTTTTGPKAQASPTGFAGTKAPPQNQSATTTSTSVSTTPTTNRSAAASSTSSSPTSQSTLTKTTVSHKNKQQTKSGLFVYSNKGYDNPAFNKDSPLPNHKETDVQQSPKTSTLRTPKTLTTIKSIRPTEMNSQSNTKITNNNKPIYSLAGKIPMSYNLTNSLDSDHQKSSSFSSISLSVSSTIKPTSDYSTASSLTPSLSSRGSTSMSSKSSTANTPDNMWLSRVETALKPFAKTKTRVTNEQLKNVLQVKESFIFERFVKVLDQDMNGQRSVEELISELRALVNGTQTEKLRFLFDIYNTKGDGHIVWKELQTFFTKLISECKLQISSDNIEALTNAFFRAADINKDGKISFDELHTMVEKRPSIGGKLGISPTATNNPDDDIRAWRCFRYFSKKYVHNNLKKVVALVVYFIINLGLMGLAIEMQQDTNTWVKVARASGMALNFNCTFVLVLMLRVTLTWLRNTPLRLVFPFDQHVLFHRVCGYVIALHGVSHTVGHIGNCVVSQDINGLSVYDQMFTTRAGVGWVKDSAYITGDVLFVVLFVMVVLSLPIVRKSGFFEVFYWSHKLYLVFWTVLILHAPNFWKWFLVPGTIFIIEHIARQPCIRAFYMGKTYIVQVSVLPSEVTHLVISRPPGFHYRSGDYVFIQIPVVAKYEWHPFTISSAPENREEIWLHIRSAGHWTRSLYKYFTDYNPDEESGSDIDPSNLNLFRGYTKRRASSIAWLKTRTSKARLINSNMRKRVVTKNVKVQIHIDGPYGTPSRHIFEEEHVVLIGSGIGITPFASILQSIVNRYKACCVQCPKCSHLWCNQPPASVMALKKVDFVWIIRDQRHFEWFTSLLCRLEREQEVEGGLGGILDIHIYMTSVPPKTDMRGMGLQLALDLVHADENTDLLTGLRTRTHGGRPDFDKLFSKIKQKSEGRRVKVFFCGAPVLGNTLKLYSHKYNFRFAHEYF